MTQSGDGCQPVAVDSAADRDVVIRSATGDDVPHLGMLRRAWTEEDRGRPAGDPEFESAFAGWMADESERRIFLVAALGDDVIGTANLIVVSRMPRPATEASSWGYLANVYVLPEHRGRGVGRRLVDRAVALAQERGCVRVVLSPSERSVPLYQDAGFGPASMLMAQVLEP